MRLRIYDSDCIVIKQGIISLTRVCICSLDSSLNQHINQFVVDGLNSIFNSLYLLRLHLHWLRSFYYWQNNVGDTVQHVHLYVRRSNQIRCFQCEQLTSCWNIRCRVVQIELIQPRSLRNGKCFTSANCYSTLILRSIFVGSRADMRLILSNFKCQFHWSIQRLRL